MHSLPKNNVAMRVMSGVLALGAMLGVAACSSDRAISAPETPPALRGAALTTGETATLLTRATPLAKDVTYSVDISGNGGRIDVPEAGLHIIVPGGAFSGKKPVRFTVTAVAGSAVAYKFGPHGMKFNKPLSATQDLSVTTYSSTTGDLESGYFASDADLDVTNKRANVSEVFPGNVSTQNGANVHFSIPHFSGYVIVTGRKDFN